MSKPPIASFASLSKRQVYSLLLKLLTLFGVVVLMAVLINSLWGLKEVGGELKEAKKTVSPKVMQVMLDDLQQGKMKRVLFQGQDIAILYRFLGNVESVEGVRNPARQETKQPTELNEVWRSIKSEYFVFINAAGPTRCPLYLSPDAQVLKDICSGVEYDNAGKNKRGGIERLIIPPHYYKDNVLFLGAWQPPVMP